MQNKRLVQWRKLISFELEGNEFVLQLRDYIHFRSDKLEKGIEPPYLLSYGLASLLFFYKDGFDIK